MKPKDVEAAFNMFERAIRRLCAPPESEWLFYKSNMHPRTFKKGELLIQPGEPSHIYAFVYTGIFKQYFITETGAEYITRFDCPGEASGDTSTLWQNLPARQFIQAVVDVEALVTTPNLLQKLRARHPVWHEGGRVLAELRYFEKCDREYELLCLDAEARYQSFLRRHGPNAALIPQKDIASYIGVTPSSLNKIIKRHARGR